MTPDDSPQQEARQWKKAIPEARDRLQSKILVWIAVPLLAWTVSETRLLPLTGQREIAYLRLVIAVSVFFTLVVWRLKAATPLAAFTGGLICFLISLYTGSIIGFFAYGGGSIFHSGLTPLVLLFILTFSATRFRKDRKAVAGLDEAGNGRNAAQIVANLGIAGVLASLWGQGFTEVVGHIGLSGTGPLENWLPRFALLRIPVLAALAEATADTVASEIGQAFPNRTFLITTFRQASTGTDGAISLIGTVSGISAAALVAAVGVPALDLTLLECGLVLIAATAGLFFDSLLGATIEREGWLGNDLVNFLSTAFAALVSMIGIRLLDWPLW